MRTAFLGISGIISVLLSMLHAWQIRDDVYSLSYLSLEMRTELLIIRLNQLPLLLLLCGLGFLIATAISLHISNKSNT